MASSSPSEEDFSGEAAAVTAAEAEAPAGQEAPKEVITQQGEGGGAEEAGQQEEEDKEHEKKEEEEDEVAAAVRFLMTPSPPPAPTTAKKEASSRPYNPSIFRRKKPAPGSKVPVVVVREEAEVEAEAAEARQKEEEEAAEAKSQAEGDGSERSPSAQSARSGSRAEADEGEMEKLAEETEEEDGPTGEQELTVDDEEPTEESLRQSYRTELIERFYSYQKEKRELRRRNTQAQTNIAQYFRKHKLNLFPSDPERSEAVVREDYNRLLKKIDSLARQKEQEAKSFMQDMADLAQQAQVLENEIGKKENEMGKLKLNAAKGSVNHMTGRPVFQKDVVEHLTRLAELNDALTPIRLKYVKLQRRLEAATEKWAEVTQGQGRRVDAMEVALETQIFEDKCESRSEEMFSMQKTIEEDVIVASHTKMKLQQQQNSNRQLCEQLREKEEQLQQLKRQTGSLKRRAVETQRRIQRLEGSVGLFAHRDLLKDYYLASG